MTGYITLQCQRNLTKLQQTSKIANCLCLVSAYFHAKRMALCFYKDKLIGHIE